MRILKCKKMPAAALTALLIFTSSLGQERKEQKKRTDEQPSLAVSLTASVLDARGERVADLGPDDFEIFEDGVKQKITRFERREGPLLYGLVVDNSGSFRGLIDRVINVGEQLIARSGAGAETFIVRFVDRSSVVQDVTTNKRALVHALEEMYVEGGQTAITDAVYLSTEHLARALKSQTASRRGGLVLITDGEDRANLHKPEQLYAKLRETNVPVLIIAFVEGARMQSSPEKARRYVERLAFESGGDVYYSRNANDPGQAVASIIAGLNSDYCIAYDSTNGKRDGKRRRIEIRIAGAREGGPFVVQTKEGYTAPDKK